MKTRTFIFEKDTYTKEEVIDIVGEVVEEAQQRGFRQYDEIYLNEKIFGRYENYDLEYSYRTPNTMILGKGYVEWEINLG